MKIDVTILGGSRPDLLIRTLDSFQEKLMKNFEIGNVFVNLDLFGGNEFERGDCAHIVKKHFENPIIQSPEYSSFGLAVKSLWSKPTSQIFLHMEDDWIFNTSIMPADIDNLFDSKTKQVALHFGRYHRYLPGRFHWAKKSYFGLDIFPDLKRPVFATSPSFIESNFARQCAALMNPNLDPEKQMSNGLVQELSDYTSKYRCRLLKKKHGLDHVTDIGRLWREVNGIEKKFRNGSSVWEEK